MSKTRENGFYWVRKKSWSIGSSPGIGFWDAEHNSGEWQLHGIYGFHVEVEIECLSDRIVLPPTEEGIDQAAADWYYQIRHNYDGPIDLAFFKAGVQWVLNRKEE